MKFNSCLAVLNRLTTFGTVDSRLPGKIIPQKGG